MSAQQNAKTIVTARIPTELSDAIRSSLKKDESLSDFVNTSLEGELSRRTLCKPETAVSLADLNNKLSAIQSLVLKQEALNRLIVSDQQLIKLTLGIES